MIDDDMVIDLSAKEIKSILSTSFSAVKLGKFESLYGADLVDIVFREIQKCDGINEIVNYWSNNGKVHWRGLDSDRFPECGSLDVLLRCLIGLSHNYKYKTKESFLLQLSEGEFSESWWEEYDAEIETVQSLRKAARDSGLPDYHYLRSQPVKYWEAQTNHGVPVEEVQKQIDKCLSLELTYIDLLSDEERRNQVNRKGVISRKSWAVRVLLDGLDVSISDLKNKKWFTNYYAIILQLLSLAVPDGIEKSTVQSVLRERSLKEEGLYHPYA